MITHIVTFRWKPETTAEDVAAIAAALSTLPGLLPVISTYRFGSDLGANGASNVDFGIVATFDSIEDWRVYDTDADHEDVRAVIRPSVAERASIQFES